MGERTTVLVGTAHGSNLWPSTIRGEISSDVSSKEIRIHEYLRMCLRRWLEQSEWLGVPVELRNLGLYRNHMIERYQSFDTLLTVRSNENGQPFAKIHYIFARSFGTTWQSEHSRRWMMRYALDVRREARWWGESPPTEASADLRWVGSSRWQSQPLFPNDLIPFKDFISSAYELFASLLEGELRLVAEKCWSLRRCPKGVSPIPAWMVPGTLSSIFEHAGKVLPEIDSLAPPLPSILQKAVRYELGYSLPERFDGRMFRCHPDALRRYTEIDDLDLDS